MTLAWHPGFRPKFAQLCFALMVLNLWLALHGYHGITGDGQIYAFQAYARINPHLAADLYLRNTSQDQFTLFSPFYAGCIRLMGLEQAARSLTLIFTLSILAAAWVLARAVANYKIAWSGAAFLLVIGGDFGASHAFQILDPFLTARLPAEALTISALACYMRGARLLSLTLASAAFLIHPLMALPGLFMLLCLWTPIRVSLIGAAFGVLASFATAMIATYAAAASGLKVMDASWLEVVRERSQFLFMQLWSIRDWSSNALPFLSLALTVISSKDERLRKLCAAAAVVGSAGLAVAFIGGTVGPVAILVQGQAWRWVWITVLVSAVLVPLTVAQVWREKCGPTCTSLLVTGWLLSNATGLACVGFAVLLWRFRGHVDPRLNSILKCSAGTFVALMTLFSLKKSWMLALHANSPHRWSFWWASHPENTFAVKILATLFIASVLYAGRRRNGVWVSPTALALLIAGSLLLTPLAFNQSRTLASAADIEEFADWARVIPNTSTVLVVPPRDVGAFVWFTLRRPNYLALDQSAGVVFSRETALEIRRRSEVLLPLMEPDWKLLSKLRAKAGSGLNSEAAAHSSPLSSQGLAQVCIDPLLGFVISPFNLGFEPIPHRHAGAWKDWNLYDCEKVRPGRSET